MQDMNVPLVSVILPVYNSEKFIREAVQSILDQTYANFELLIFNDASTDGTWDLLKSFEDPRIKLFNSDTNVGYLMHLNEGIRIAKGKYLARMDADDISLNERFKEQVDFLENNEDVGVCGTAIEIFGDRNKTYVPSEKHDDILFDLLLFSPIVHPSVMIRRSILDENEILYDQDFYTAEDYHLWVRLSNITKFHNLSKVLLKYRWYGGNISNTKQELQNSTKKLIQKEALKELFIDEEISELELEIHSFLISPYNEGVIDWKAVSEWVYRLKKAKGKREEKVINIYSKHFETLAHINRGKSKNYLPYGVRLLFKYLKKTKLLKLSILTILKVPHNVFKKSKISKNI